MARKPTNRKVYAFRLEPHEVSAVKNIIAKMRGLETEIAKLREQLPPPPVSVKHSANAFPERKPIAKPNGKL